eukprot:3614764-Prorocentrum_lima.AAC.1
MPDHSASTQATPQHYNDGHTADASGYQGRMETGDTTIHADAHLRKRHHTREKDEDATRISTATTTGQHCTAPRRKPTEQPLTTRRRRSKEPQPPSSTQRTRATH